MIPAHITEASRKAARPAPVRTTTRIAPLRETPLIGLLLRRKRSNAMGFFETYIDETTTVQGRIVDHM
jgi:hypothetical protein